MMQSVPRLPSPGVILCRQLPSRLTAGVSCEELTPVKNEEYSLEGSTVTLSCRYSKQAAGGDYFFWYRQYPGKPPEFIMFISGMNITRPAESLKSDTRFFTELTEEKRRVDLQISSAAVTDSAVYYCAVRPTVTGNIKTLYKTIEAETTQYSTTSTRGSHTLLDFSNL
ncbi:hypothetical protein ABVT39_009180 [Epinephelus coioides]